MVSIPKIKEKINKVIETYGNDVIIRSPGVKTYDEWGESSTNNQTDVQTVGVTDRYNEFDMQIVSKTKVANADLVLLLKGDEVLSEEHTIIIDGVEYSISSIEKLKVSNITIAYNVMLDSKE